MKTEIKVAIITGGVAIIVALISIFGTHKPEKEIVKPMTPAGQAADNRGQTVIGNHNNTAGGAMIINANGVKGKQIKP